MTANEDSEITVAGNSCWDTGFTEEAWLSAVLFEEADIISKNSVKKNTVTNL